MGWTITGGTAGRVPPPAVAERDEPRSAARGPAQKNLPVGDAPLVRRGQHGKPVRVARQKELAALCGALSAAWGRKVSMREAADSALVLAASDPAAVVEAVRGRGVGAKRGPWVADSPEVG